MSEQIIFPVDAILLLGPTGVGKSPLGDAIARQGFLGRRALHLDFGAELRSIVKLPVDCSPYTSDERDFVLGVLERGLLLENEHFPLARKIITLFLLRNAFCPHDLLVLNGIPRHAGQAQDIATLARIHALVVLDCTEDAVYCRLKENIGGDRTERIDDHADLVAEKIKTFLKRTQPLIDHYRSMGCKTYHLQVSETSTTVQTASLLASLAAADPPVSLVAEPPQR